MRQENESAVYTGSLARVLALQDLLRIRAQLAAKRGNQLDVGAFVCALPATVAASLSAVLARFQIELATEHILAVSTVITLGLKIAATLYKNSARHFNWVSRRALAIAMPCRAFDAEPRQVDWEAVYSKVDRAIAIRELDAHIADPKQAARFATWWQLAGRDAGLPRLAGLLIENVGWTKDILRSAKRRRQQRLTGAVVIFTLVLFMGIILAPASTRSLVESAVLPIILFLLAINGLGLSRDVHNAQRECEAIYNSLRGIETQENTEASVLASMGRYFAVSSAIPPVSSADYSRMRSELSRRYSASNLQKDLSGA